MVDPDGEARPDPDGGPDPDGAYLTLMVLIIAVVCPLLLLIIVFADCFWTYPA